MIRTRLVANILFYLTRLASWLYLITGVYAFVVIAAFKMTRSSVIPLEVYGDGRFFIFYPFTKVPFLTGEYTNLYLFTLLVIIFGYGIFLWLLSNVFYAFKREKLFTVKAVKDLNWFYMVNLTVPLAMLVLFVFFKQDVTDLVILTCLHFIIGVFAYFMAAIFKQGLLLQEEQDLTL